MATGTGQFPNRPFLLRIEVWYNWQSGTRASQHTEVWIDKQSYSPSYSGCCSSFEVWVDSVGLVQSWSGGYDFRNGNNFLIHASDREVNVNGNGDSGAQVYANYDVLGYTQASTWHDGTPPSPPNAPTMTSTSAVTTTSFSANYSRGSDNGNGIDYDHVQWSTNSGFTAVVWDDTPPNGNPSGVSNPSGGSPPVALTPGTTYHVRARSHNVNGWSGWSNTISQATLPSTPPTVSVAPSLNGQSSLLTITPPGGVSGVTEYNIEFRPFGGGTTAYAQPGTTKTFTGLTPGAVYEYRANAEIGTYTSPWSSWTATTQPNPNTNPGNYFDGSTADLADLDYGWVGTVNNSRSEATAFGVDGWDAEFSTTAGVLYRVLGGYVSTHAARVAFTKDATSANQWNAGQSMAADAWAEVAGAQTYTFSIYVNPSRSQRLAAAAMRWNGSTTTRVDGTPQVVPANQWTRLSITTLLPSDTIRAAVRVIDASGTGFSVMLGGQSILLDGAMVSLGAELLPYFDGNTPDTQEYQYDWLGLPFFSDSSRSVNTSVFVDPLADPDCPPVPAPPLPPVIDQDCIEEIGSWRRYFVQIPSTDIPLWGSVLPTLTLRTISTAERQVRIRYYPNPDGLSPDLMDLSNWQGEMILTYIPPDTELTLDGVTQRVWAEVGGNGTVVAGDQLLFGTGGVPATWPELACGVGYIISLDVPLESSAGNLGVDLSLTQRI
jgi:hypothetical protein